MLLLGAALGLVVLGLGGRLAMRSIASTTRADVVLTAGGTGVVLLAGTASGVGGAVLFLLARASRIALRGGVWLQYLVFAGLLLWISLRGLNPVDPVKAAYFLPLVACYAVLYAWAAERWIVRDARAAASPRAQPV